VNGEICLTEMTMGMGEMLNWAGPANLGKVGTLERFTLQLRRGPESRGLREKYRRDVWLDGGTLYPRGCMGFRGGVERGVEYRVDDTSVMLCQSISGRCAIR
jgi:hypothetical protein